MRRWSTAAACGPISSAGGLRGLATWSRLEREAKRFQLNPVGPVPDRPAEDHRSAVMAGIYGQGGGRLIRRDRQAKAETHVESDVHLFIGEPAKLLDQSED